MKMFEFTGLRVLHKDMKRKGEERATFTFEYNKKAFSCIFLTDIIPYRLYLTTLGLYPIVFEFEIIKGYLTPCYIDEYKRLVDYLEIKFNPLHKFVPYDFFEVLNKKVPEKFSMRPNYKDTLVIASKRRKIEESDKIYFSGWKRNSAGKTVTGKNLEKTRCAFGDAKAEMSRSKNISSCWTNSEDEEDLKKLSDIVSM